jgi:uronate dehydrogenase
LSSRPFKRLLLTGAAGALGRVLRPAMRGHASVLRVSDIQPMEASGSDEVVVCDLADKAGTDALVAGCDAIVHLGGISVERPFEEIIESNIRGSFHLYEGARRHGVKRVVFASSNHVVGFHPQDEHLETDCERRPDGYYGISKAFGEDLSRFYFDRYGIETVCLRIGSAYAAPKDQRMLSTWLSFADLEALVARSLLAPDVGHLIAYGVSANPSVWWSNAKAAARLGFEPRDTSAAFKDSGALPAALPGSPEARFQGGSFVTRGPYETLPEVAP